MTCINRLVEISYHVDRVKLCDQDLFVCRISCANANCYLQQISMENIVNARKFIYNLKFLNECLLDMVNKHIPIKNLKIANTKAPRSNNNIKELTLLKG